MTLRHPALALILALILALASQTAAVARTAMSAPGLEMTLCTGDGPVTVTLDAQGNPVVPSHHCPACILALSMPPLATAPVQPPRILRPLPPARAAPLPARGPSHPTPPVRAPPLSA